MTSWQRYTRDVRGTAPYRDPVRMHANGVVCLSADVVEGLGPNPSGRVHLFTNGVPGLFAVATAASPRDSLKLSPRSAGGTRAFCAKGILEALGKSRPYYAMAVPYRFEHGMLVIDVSKLPDRAGGRP